ncbi:MAG TPA: hypothetical protein VL651_15630 [Bacteroidia bacterium]|jgi:hypothetical protein|nr:hypothetical protein [Bacteroidia bacterium]
METQLKSVELLTERALHYGEARFELFRLKAIGKTADTVSSLGAKMVVLLVLGIGFFSLNIGLALWLGDLLGKFYYGFFIMGAFYCLAGFITHIFRINWMKNPIRNFIITRSIN